MRNGHLYISCPRCPVSTAFSSTSFQRSKLKFVSRNVRVWIRPPSSLAIFLPLKFVQWLKLPVTTDQFIAVSDHNLIESVTLQAIQCSYRDLERHSHLVAGLDIRDIPHCRFHPCSALASWTFDCSRALRKCSSVIRRCLFPAGRASGSKWYCKAKSWMASMVVIASSWKLSKQER